MDYKEGTFKHLQTGDLVLFSGKCHVAKLIKIISWSKWSHVGMIINDDPNHNFPLLYESTHNKSIKGLDVGRHTEGVQVVPFAERLQAYNGAVAIRRVIEPCYANRHRLRLYRSEMVGVPFEESWVEVLASSYLFSWLRKDEDLSSVFCSEHIAQALMSLGWLSEDKPSNHYSPKFFVENNDYLKGVSYSEIEVLKTK